jgi:hypothetical protein
MDIKTAFLNGDFEKKMYMEQFEGFTQGGEQLVCQLHKSLYSLKQPLRAWNQKLNVFLKNIEFVKSDVDFNVYVQVIDVNFFIVFYVDDLILVCNNKDKFLQVKEKLFQTFEMKDLGDIHFFLGMEVERDHVQHLLYINQIGYLKRSSNTFAWRIAKLSKCHMIQDKVEEECEQG